MRHEPDAKAKKIQAVAQNIQKLRDFTTAKGIGEYGALIADIMDGLQFKILEIEESVNPGNAFITDEDVARPLR